MENVEGEGQVVQPFSIEPVNLHMQRVSSSAYLGGQAGGSSIGSAAGGMQDVHAWISKLVSCSPVQAKISPSRLQFEPSGKVISAPWGSTLANACFFRHQGTGLISIGGGSQAGSSPATSCRGV
jgi:hypothetical protein